MTLNEIIHSIEAEGFQWAVCREKDGQYTAFVTEHHTLYPADALADGLGCEGGSTPTIALEVAFYKELGYREKRRLE